MKYDTDNIFLFFELLWGNADQGTLALCSIKAGNLKPFFFDISGLDAFYHIGRHCEVSSANGGNVYHTLGLLSEKPQKGRGTELDVLAIPGYWMDIDLSSGMHKKTNLPNSIQESFKFLELFPFKPTLIVNSGGGIHVYWLFKEPWYFENDNERNAARLLSDRFQQKLIAIGKDEFNWNLDLTSDLVRLLRIPETFNFKSNPRKVSIIAQNSFRYNPNDFDSYLITDNSANSRQYLTNSENKQFNSKLIALFNKCEFLRHCRDNARNLPEPNWFCMVGSLCFEPGSRPLIHEYSKNYPNYSQKETELKIRNAQDRKSGPITCKKIQEMTGFKCPEHGCGVTSPVHLKWKSITKNSEITEFSQSATQPPDISVNNINHTDRNNPEIKANNWPVLSDKALDGIAGRFVELATRNSEADPAAVLATFLVRFGVECGPNPTLMVGDTKHKARLFAVIVGNSSKARKGTAGKLVNRLFEFENIFFDPETGNDGYKPALFSPGPLSSGEGLINAVRDPVEVWKIDRKTKQGYWEVVDPGIEDKRLIIHDEEFASAISCTKREGNTSSTIIRCSWDTGDLDPLTKTSKIKTTGAHIGICTHITQSELELKFNEGEAFNGFANRFLWICARRNKKVAIPEPMPEEELISLQLTLIDRIKKAQQIGIIKLSEKARDRWIQVYPEISKDRGGFIGTILNRSEAQVLRISMIYALLDGEDSIGLDHLESGLALWDYIEQSVKHIFSGKVTDKNSSLILKSLQGGKKSKTELFNIFNRKIRKKDLDKALGDLLVMGIIEEDIIQDIGKPKTIYSIKKQ